MRWMKMSLCALALGICAPVAPVASWDGGYATVRVPRSYGRTVIRHLESLPLRPEEIGGYLHGHLLLGPVPAHCSPQAFFDAVHWTLYHRAPWEGDARPVRSLAGSSSGTVLPARDLLPAGFVSRHFVSHGTIAAEELEAAGLGEDGFAFGHGEPVPHPNRPRLLVDGRWCVPEYHIALRPEPNGRFSLGGRRVEVLYLCKAPDRSN